MLYQKQIDQYQAYSDRYLKFKVEFRELVPYNKTKQPWLGTLAEVSYSFKKLGQAIYNASAVIRKISFNEHEVRRFALFEARENYIAEIKKIEAQYKNDLIIHSTKPVDSGAEQK